MRQDTLIYLLLSDLALVHTPGFGFLNEAISEVFEDEYGLGDFTIEKHPAVPIKDVLEMAKDAYRPFIEPGLLKGLPADLISKIKQNHNI